MTRSVYACALLLLAACAEETVPVPTGDFVFERAEPEGVLESLEGTLSVDPDGAFITFVDADGEIVLKQDLVEHDASDRYTDCYTNYSHATMDTYKVLDPLNFGGVVSIPRPMLTTGCDGADVRIGAWSADGGGFAEPILHFVASE